MTDSIQYCKPSISSRALHTPSQSNKGLHALSKEILLIIFTYVPPPDQGSISLVCRTFRHLSAWACFGLVKRYLLDKTAKLQLNIEHVGYFTSAYVPLINRLATQHFKIPSKIDALLTSKAAHERGLGAYLLSSLDFPSNILFQLLSSPSCPLSELLREFLELCKKSEKDPENIDWVKVNHFLNIFYNETPLVYNIFAKYSFEKPITSHLVNLLAHLPKADYAKYPLLAFTKAIVLEQKPLNRYQNTDPIPEHHRLLMTSIRNYPTFYTKLPKNLQKNPHIAGIAVNRNFNMTQSYIPNELLDNPTFLLSIDSPDHFYKLMQRASSSLRNAIEFAELSIQKCVGSVIFFSTAIQSHPKIASLVLKYYRRPIQIASPEYVLQAARVLELDKLDQKNPEHRLPADTTIDVFEEYFGSELKQQRETVVTIDPRILVPHAQVDDDTETTSPKRQKNQSSHVPIQATEIQTEQPVSPFLNPEVLAPLGGLKIRLKRRKREF